MRIEDERTYNYMYFKYINIGDVFTTIDNEYHMKIKSYDGCSANAVNLKTGHCHCISDLTPCFLTEEAKLIITD